MPENDNKEEVNKVIEMVSKAVTKIRDEIRLCDKIEVKVPVMKENLKELKNRENEKQVEEN